MGIISGLESFRGQFEDHFRVGDNFGVGINSGAVQASLENWREKSLRVRESSFNMTSGGG